VSKKQIYLFIYLFIYLYNASSWNTSNRLNMLVSSKQSLFGDFVKLSVLIAGSRRLTCMKLHTVGPATVKARRLNVLRRYRGTISRWRLAERWRERLRSLMWWTTMHGHTELVLYWPRKRKNACSDSHKDFDRVRLSGRPETETDIVFLNDTGELLHYIT